MTNATHTKYLNLYNVNRGYNSQFDNWIAQHYEVKVSYEMWSWGSETFIDRETGEVTFSEAKIMFRYVKAKGYYFKNFDERSSSR